MGVFDQGAKTYDQWIDAPLGSFSFKKEVELLFQLAEPIKDEKVLEIGCGTGLLTVSLVQRGLDVIGMDISMEMVKVTRSKQELQSAAILQGDITNIPFPDKSIDLIIGNIVLEFVDNPDSVFQHLITVQIAQQLHVTCKIIHGNTYLM